MRIKRKSPFRYSIHHHLKNQKSLYLFMIVLFMMGVIFGSIIVNTLDPVQKEGLLHYLGHFFDGLKQDAIAEPKVVFQHAIGDQLKTVGLLWILGLSVIGIPIVVIYIFLKGMVIGFTVGFLVNQLSWQGLWFAFVSVVPQNLLVIPAIIIVAVSGIHFSITLVKNRLIHHYGTIYPQFISFSMVAATMAFVMVCAALMESYLSPVVMKTAIPMIPTEF